MLPLFVDGDDAGLPGERNGIAANTTAQVGDGSVSGGDKTPGAVGGDNFTCRLFQSFACKKHLSGVREFFRSLLPQQDRFQDSRRLLRCEVFSKLCKQLKMVIRGDSHACH
jgi:hypothetical protein